MDSSDPSFSSGDIPLGGKRRRGNKGGGGRRNEDGSSSESSSASDDDDGIEEEEEDSDAQLSKKLARSSERKKDRKDKKKSRRNVELEEDQDERGGGGGYASGKKKSIKSATSKGLSSPLATPYHHPPDEAHVRSKVREGFAQALDLAIQEIKQQQQQNKEKGAEAEAAGEGPAVDVGTLDSKSIAAELESALFLLHQGTTKAYKERYRTLVFNLKDPHNPDLRYHVLLGDITVDRFVQMTAQELANKELAEYRKRKEEEALKMSVLDADAAAKFSTAAALEARDTKVEEDQGKEVGGGKSGRLPTSPSGVRAGASTGENLLPTSPIGGELNDDDFFFTTSPQEHGSGGGGSGMETGTEDKMMMGALLEEQPSAQAKIDWASVKAAAAAAAEEVTKTAPKVEFEPIKLTSTKGGKETGGDKGEEGGDKEFSFDIIGGGKNNSNNNDDDDDEYDPIAVPIVAGPPPSSTTIATGGVGVPSNKEAGKYSHLFLSAPDPFALSPAVWQGFVDVPDSGLLLLTIDALAGSADLAGLLGERGHVEIKGKLNPQQVETFLYDLRNSRSRTVTMGIMKPAPPEAATAANRDMFYDLISYYSRAQKVGVITMQEWSNSEAYLIPPGSLAEALLRDASTTGLYNSSNNGTGVPASLEEDELLLVAIHKRGWMPAMGFRRPVKATVPPLPRRIVVGVPPPSSSPPELGGMGMRRGTGGGGGRGGRGGHPHQDQQQHNRQHPDRRSAPMQIERQQQQHRQQQPPHHHQQLPGAGTTPPGLPPGLNLAAISALAQAMGVAPSTNKDSINNNNNNNDNNKNSRGGQ